MAGWILCSRSYNPLQCNCFDDGSTNNYSEESSSSNANGSGQETLHTLNHWRTTFRTYYRRDSFFKAFLLPDATWNPGAADYGQLNELSNGTIIRTGQDKAEDLKDFLNTLMGFLPFPYLTERVLKATRNLEEVWTIIYDHYGLTITGETFLDFNSMTRIEGETYRQFYDRLLAHTHMHLPGQNVSVDGVSSGPNGEKMTVGLMNFVAMSWLAKIHPNLINLVKIEYSKDLREGTQLAELVPRITLNIDALLAKNDSVTDIDNIRTTSDDNSLSVNKVKFKSNKQKPNKLTQQRSPFCPECHYLSKKLQLQVDFKHVPSDCPRP